MMQLTNNHRRDLIQRPLLRMFRRFLKKEALSISSYEFIRGEPLRNQGKLLCEALGVPWELAASKRNQCALLLMVSSHRITWRKNLIPVAQDLMTPFYNEIWPLFFRIFNETSHK